MDSSRGAFVDLRFLWCLWCMVLGVITSTVNGRELWRQTPGPCGGQLTNYVALHGGAVVACSPTDVVRSTNGGLTWMISDAGLPQFIQPTQLVQDGNGILYLTLFIKGFFRSTNGGVTWDSCAGIPFGGYNYSSITFGWDQTAFVAAYQGNHVGWSPTTLFRSTDRGATWVRADSGVNVDAWYSAMLASTDKALYQIANSAAGGGVAYRSTNSAVSWDTLNIGNTNTDTLSMLKVIPGGTLLAEVNDTVHHVIKMLRSTDKGRVWTTTGSGLPALSYPYAQWFQDDSAGAQYIETIIVSNTDTMYTVYRSADKGASWSQVTFTGISGSVHLDNLFPFSGHSLVNVRSVQPSSDTVHALYATSDKGATWEQCTGLPTDMIVSAAWVNNNAVIISVHSSDTVVNIYGFHVYRHNDLYRSSDDGLTWNLSNSGLPPNTFATVVFPVGGNTLLASVRTFYNAYNDDVYRSSDNGRTWQLSNTGIFSSLIASIAVDSAGRIYASTHLQSGGYRSTDNGDSWQRLGGGLPAYGDIFFAADRTGTVYASHSTQGVFVSMDHGDTWTVRNGNLANTFMTGVCVTPAGTLLTCSQRGIYSSSDQGVNWTASVTNVPNDQQYTPFAVKNDNVVFVAINGGPNSGVFKTTDGGKNWNPANTGLGANTATVGIGITRAGTMLAGTFSGLYRSTNEGVTWALTGANQINYSANIWGIGSLNDQSIVVTGTVNGSSAGSPLYHSTDDGIHWQKFNNGLTQGANGICLAVAPNNQIFIGTQSNSVWRGVENVSAVRQTSLPVPTESAVLFPNPSHNGSMLSFRLGEQTRVNVAVFDALGREVARRDLGMMEMGEHRVPVSFAVDLPAGVYEYAITTRAGVFTRRGVVVK